MIEALKEHNIIEDINDIQGTGHRVVHGENYSQNQHLLPKMY